MTFHDLFAAEVAIVRDVHYSSLADPRRSLDVYSPVAAATSVGASGYPVVMFFHGGGWRSGDKRLFEHLGRAYAVRGFVAVTVNYRLTPSVRSPEHARDCAAAVAWTHANIARYNGDPDAIHLTGHSAGGHLAALVTLDGRYRADAGPGDFVPRSVVVISGVVDLRDHSETTVHTSREQIEEAFGSSHEELAEGSPASFVREGLPPFLVIVAENDPPGLRRQGKHFTELLREAGGEALYISIKGRDHFSIVRRFGPSDDPTIGAIVDFIRHYNNHEQ